MRSPRLGWPAAGAALAMVGPYAAYRASGHELGDHRYWGPLAGPIATALWWGGVVVLGGVSLVYVIRELRASGPRPPLVPKDPQPQEGKGESFGRTEMRGPRVM